jgi:hypothetical protein
MRGDEANGPNAREESVELSRNERIELASDLAICAGQQVTFYVWSGGEDSIVYFQNHPKPSGNDDICVSMGTFNDEDGGQRWSGMGSVGVLHGQVHYCISGLVVKAELNAQLVASIGSLYDSDTLSDITIVVGVDRVSLPAHSVILAVRSKVFSAMLQAPMREAMTKHITIEDMEVEVVRQMLRFLYTCEVEQSVLEKSSCIMALLHAAHRFEVLPLVQVCERALEIHIKVATVAEILEEADMLKCTSLRDFCMAFVVEHAAEVQKTDGFKHLAETCPRLMMDLFGALAAPRKKQRVKQ